jgi:hypothetical protein
MRIRQFSLGAAVLALAACGPSISVTNDRDASIPIPSGATYAFTMGANVGEQVDPLVQNDIVHQRIQQSINNQLTAKGFKRVDNEAQADFIVRYFLAIKKKTEYQTTSTGVGVSGYPGYGYGYGWGMSGGTSTTTPIEVREGGFVVDLLQKGGKLAWRGMATGEAQYKAPTQERVDKLVTKVMETLKSGV